MNILIIGNGGREHALAWQAAKSPDVTHVFVAPGNAGTARENKVSNVQIPAIAIDSLIKFAKENQIDLTIVGPEAPLALGIVDAFLAANLACFGPTKAAAQLETSKKFAKDFMTEHGIATAAYQSFTDVVSAKNYVRQHALPIVIKADGLAAGKGVVIAETLSQADQTIDAMLSGNQFGNAGHRIVIEEFLQGEEATFIVLSDGKNVIPLVSSQDHKARDEEDKGPNTGGMGAYSPAPVVTASIEHQVLNTVIKPVIQGMAAKGTPFVGFLYAGLMINNKGEAKVLEFNCRLGDPEAEVLLMRLQSNIVTLCQTALAEKLSDFSIQWDPRPALDVILAADGYPNHYDNGFIINGLDAELPDCKVFHAGTALQNDQVVTNGGRVLCVTAIAEDLPTAQKLAYQQVAKIHWQGMYCRTDIGFKGIRTQ